MLACLFSLLSVTVDMLKALVMYHELKRNFTFMKEEELDLS